LMSRLASFRGPSTPSASPVQKRQSSVPVSPSRIIESTYHRKIRALLQELRLATEIWEDLVLVDGLKAAQSLIDTRTDLDNELSLLSSSQPRYQFVGPKLAFMEQRIVDLDTVINKLDKQFRKMDTVVDNMETVLIEAHKVKGWKWVRDEPLWVTWSLEKFVTSVAEILIPYHRSLNAHIGLVDMLRNNTVSFETSHEVISKWVEQPWFEGSSWDAKWGDLCEVEVERWSN
ncbi:hypothetical protein BDZ94DRAFT_1173213, partial [Collybia nuda]